MGFKLVTIGAKLGDKFLYFKPLEMRKPLQTPTTKIRCYFCIFGDHFPLNDFTQKMELLPTETSINGEIYQAGKNQFISETTAWTFGIDYQRTKNPTIQVHQLIDSLLTKVETIKHYQKQYSLTCKIAIIIHFKSDTQTPGLNFDHKLIQFAYETNSEY